MNEPHRIRLDDFRPSVTHHGTFDKLDYYVTVGFYDDEGRRAEPGEVFVVIAKEGSDIRRFVNAWAVMVSMALQYGVPWLKIRNKFTGHLQATLLERIVESVELCVEYRRQVIGEEGPGPAPSATEQP